MTADLRTSLQQLADEAASLPVDDDLWQRGRAVRRRDQIFAITAALALIVCAGGIATLVLGEGHEAPAAAESVEGGAIPSRIVDPGEGSGPLETNLTVGRASVAFVSSSGEPVVVTARDGVTHRLSLTGWADGSAALALSPDGRTLAYQQDPDHPDTTLGLLDLETGRSWSPIAQAGETLRLRGLTWSPDGSWLVWIGDGSLQRGAQSIVGALRSDGGRGQHVFLPYLVSDAAVANNGALFWGRGSGGIFQDRSHGRPDLMTHTKSVGVGPVSPDGRLIALSSSLGRASRTLVVDEREIVDHPFPADTIGPSEVRPLGWIDDRLQLLMVQPSASSAAELVITTPEVNDTSTWRRSVGAVSPEATATVSVAVDLIPDLDGTSSQRFTHDFAGPGSDTPRWRAGVSLLIGLGVAAALSALFLLRLLWRRLL